MLVGGSFLKINSFEFLLDGSFLKIKECRVGVEISNIKGPPRWFSQPPSLATMVETTDHTVREMVSIVRKEIGVWKEQSYRDREKYQGKLKVPLECCMQRKAGIDTWVDNASMRLRDWWIREKSRLTLGPVSRKIRARWTNKDVLLISR